MWLGIVVLEFPAPGLDGQQVGAERGHQRRARVHGDGPLERAG